MTELPLTTDTHIDEVEYLELICSTSLGKHIIHEPVRLVCGHAVCQKCIPRQSTHKIRCLKCNDVFEIDFEKIKVSRSLLRLFNEHLNKLSVNVYKELRLNISRIEDHQDYLNDECDSCLEYIEDNIELRVESLKIYLDDAVEKLLNRIAKAMNGYLRYGFMIYLSDQCN